MDIPLLRERLEGYVLKKEFEFRVEDTAKILEDCSTCLTDVQGSISLKTMLRFVLDVGNAMNKGYANKKRSKKTNKQKINKQKKIIIASHNYIWE
jgi:hypothetical protein